MTVGRIFSDTFAGIAPASVPGFVAAQLIGAAAGLGLLLILFPSASRTGGRRRASALFGPGPAPSRGGRV